MASTPGAQMWVIESFRGRVRQLDAKDLVFIDETGITTAMTRRYARAARGERAHGSAPRRLAAADCPEGTLRRGDGGGHEYRGGHNHASVDGLLTIRADPRTAPPPSGRHRADGQSVRAQAQAGRDRPDQSRVQAPLPAALLARPSPIEPGWSKLKSALRAAEARTPDVLEAALNPALDSITPTDARGWFNHCGYSFPN